ncbi:hypothetical protein [Viridibacillus arvi]|uniref:hypothetical protein n=1 Tax=Viridibacillus arvi TaxID=263475 RepID=UPI0034CDB6C2
MFKAKGEDLQLIVDKVKRAAKRARLNDSHVFVSSHKEGIVSFFFAGDELQVQREMECTTEGEFEFATTTYELECKILALPADEIIHIEKNGNHASLKWGRSSKIAMELVPELSPGINIPEAKQKVVWSPGELHKIARSLPQFTAIKNSACASQFPVTRCVNFMQEDTGEVLVRATNSARAVTLQPLGLEWFEGFSAAIPTETILALVEMIPSDVSVNVSVNEEHTLLVFEAGRMKAVTRLLEGDYPAIDKSFTLPTEAKSIWRVDRLELLNTARRIRRLKGDAPKMMFSKDGTKTFVTLQGVLVEQIGAIVEGEANVDFIINADFIEICLNLYRCEEVLICVRDEPSLPITIVGASEGEDSNEKIKTLLAQAQGQ